MLITRSSLISIEMGVLLAFGQGEVERLLGGDRLVIRIVEGAITPIDVQLAACLLMPLGLDGAALLCQQEWLTGRELVEQHLRRWTPLNEALTAH